MIGDIENLKPVDEEEFDLKLSEVLAARVKQYQDAVPEEILDLLEEAAETYAILAPLLPQRLGKAARKEIEFLVSLYKEKLRKFFHIQNPQLPHNILNTLSGFTPYVNL